MNLEYNFRMQGTDHTLQIKYVVCLSLLLNFEGLYNQLFVIKTPDIISCYIYYISLTHANNFWNLLWISIDVIPDGSFHFGYLVAFGRKLILSKDV